MNNDFNNKTQEHNEADIMNTYEVAQTVNNGNGVPPKKGRKGGRKLILGVLILSLLTNVYLFQQLNHNRGYTGKRNFSWGYHSVTQAADTQEGHYYTTEYGYLDMDSLISIAPHVNSADIREICFSMIDNGSFDVNMIGQLAPHMNSEDIRDVVVYAVECGLISSDTEVTIEEGTTIRFNN